MEAVNYGYFCGTNCCYKKDGKNMGFILYNRYCRYNVDDSYYTVKGII